MKIKELKVNYIENPIGYRLDHIHLSWKVVDTREKNDVWTQVLIADDENFKNLLFDSGKMSQYGQPFYDANLELQPYTRYFWKVLIQAGTDVSESSIAFFETAKMKESWQAEFIGARKEDRAMPFIYKEIKIEKQVKKARIYCTGHGLYELYIDGKKQGTEYLLPGYHSYDLLQEYQTFDISDFLSTGIHTIGFMLGEGWYKGRFVFDGGYSNLYGNQKEVISEIHIYYEDDTEEIIGTNKEWKGKETQVLENGIYDGEVIDFDYVCKNLEIEECVADKSLLTERLNPRIHAVETYPVKQILKTAKGEWVIDFGEMITGWVEFIMPDEHDTEICLTYSEIMQENNFYRDNLRTAKAEFRTRGNSRGSIRPHFTYFGFRYVKVDGINEPKAENFIAVRLMSDVPITGEIKTSNEKVNKLIDNSLRSQKCNFLDIPTDCPQRDERMGWTGDIAVYAETASFHMETTAFLHHYMMNLIPEEKLTKGAVPFFVPRPKVEPHEGVNLFLVTEGATTWGDVATVIPWTLYRYFRDIEMLKIHYECMSDWVNYITERTKENKTPYLWQNDNHLGDWLALDNGNIHNPIGATNSQFIASANYYNSVGLCANVAKVLRLEEDYKTWTDLRIHIKDAFLKEYLDENGDIKGERTQTAYALLLSFGIYDEKSKSILEAGLRRTLKEYNNHLSTGFAATHLLCPALSENGMNDLAYTLLLNEDYPSWLNEINLGATTIWERWNSIDADGRISPEGMNSLNHYAYGSIVGWIYQYVCGFRWDENGDLFLNPMPDERLKYAEGKIECIYGTCKSKWEYQKNGGIMYTFEIPFQAKVKVVLPYYGEYILGSGIHTIRTFR